MTYNMCVDHNVFPLFEYIPKPPCSVLLFAHQCSVLFYSSSHPKHNPDSALLQDSVELTHQDPQKNPINSKSSPKIPHVTNGAETLIPERALGSLHPILLTLSTPRKPIGPPVEMGSKTVLSQVLVSTYAINNNS